MGKLYSGKKPNKFFILLIIAVFALSACIKEVNSAPGGNAGVNTVPVGSTPVTDIYFAGYIANSENGIATFWKNDIPSPFSKSTNFSIARAVTINGSNIYFAGDYRAANGKEVAVYWKNGKMTKLTDSSAYYNVTGIAVNANDIYVAGYYSTDITATTHPIYWKNGVQIALTLGNAASTLATQDATANAIAVQNNDVYVVGTLSYNVAVYWKNGVITILPASNGFASAAAIALNGGDVYVVGDTGAGYNPNSQVTNAAVYWKNGIATMLASNNSHGSGITIQGNDVYIAGSTNNSISKQTVATYRKNGVATTLQTGPEFSYANGIAVNDSDIYVVGNDANMGAMCWKNGQSIKLSNTNSSIAYGAAVFTH